MTGVRTSIAVAIVLIATVRLVNAQIVNVQGQLAKPPDQDGINGQVEAKIDWREGNNTLIQIGGSAAVLVRHGKLIALAIARGEYGQSRGLTLSKKTFEHVRARYTIDCRWKWEAFLQHEYDAFRRLSIRAVAGTGPALQILDENSLAVLAGAAVMLEYEQLDTRPGTIDAGERTIAQRASLYVTGTEKVGGGVSIVQTVYVQPRLAEPDDVRILGEVSVTTQLSSRLALTNALVVAFDRTPPDAIKRFDSSLVFGILVKF
jgi:uncharacterized protein DUF481